MEIVVVDDHSFDGTPAIASSLAAARGNLRYLRLSRNCGAHIACAAGLDHCTGDAAIIMAADLQDPPEVISALAAAWSQGNDVVWAVRSRAREKPGARCSFRGSSIPSCDPRSATFRSKGPISFW